MKRTLTVTLTLLAMLSLTAVAHADVIISPMDAAGDYIMRYLPWVLVGAVVGVTIFLLRKLWKK